MNESGNCRAWYSVRESRYSAVPDVSIRRLLSEEYRCDRM
jgi:hypothetical protein